MSTHILLNLLNKPWKRDKMRGLWAQMSASIYHMTLKLLKISFLACNVNFGFSRFYADFKLDLYHQHKTPAH